MIAKYKDSYVIKVPSQDSSQQFQQETETF